MSDRLAAIRERAAYVASLYDYNRTVLGVATQSIVREDVPLLLAVAEAAMRIRPATVRKWAKSRRRSSGSWTRDDGDLSLALSDLFDALIALDGGDE